MARMPAHSPGKRGRHLENAVVSREAGLVTWFWVLFPCAVLLALAGRILRGKAGQRFVRLRAIVNVVNFYIGRLLLILFLSSFILGVVIMKEMESN